jgi:hypothetical protein
MAYTLTYTGGTISITEGTVNTTKTSLALPGHNYVNYGQQVDQNMLSLLENFASSGTSGPSHPIKGQLWYDDINGVLKYNTNNTTPAWISLSTAGANANITANSVTASTFTSTSHYIYSVATGISAGGSTQGDATALTKDINVVTTVNAGQGVQLPSTTGGMRITVMNADSGDTLKVYPASGAQINSLGANAPLSVVAGGRLDFISTTGSQWYTLTATYS